MEVGVADNGNCTAAARTSVVPVVPWAVMLAVFWTAVIVVSLVWNTRQVRELVLEQAQIELRASFFKDLSFRNWATRHGGVYVPVTPETQPDPYVANMPERDVRTPSGRLLTLINPALMVRQFNEMAAGGDGARGHLISLNPINPLNRPDAWEAGALVKFGQGIEEVSGIAEIEGAPYLRLIRPMKMGHKCLGCHVGQGYQEGDLAGDVQRVGAARPAQCGCRQARQRAGARAWRTLVLRRTGNRRRGLAAAAAHRRSRNHSSNAGGTRGSHAGDPRCLGLDGIVAINANNVIIDWNFQGEQIFGWPRDEALGRSLSETIIPERFRAQHAAGLMRGLEASGAGEGTT